MKDNRGSSLILVIICIAFAGILGTTVLVNATANRDMKLVDEMAKENFYQTESGLDIFLANLSYLSEDVMKDAYTYVLTHYSAADNDTLLKAQVKQNLFFQLTGSPYSDGAEATVKEELLKKGSDGTLKGTLFEGVAPELYGTQLRLLNLEEGRELKAVADGDDIVLKELSVVYQENGYETMITTDVRVKVEFTRLDVETPVTVSGKYMDYSIITDENLLVPESGSEVTGNVYAGDSVVADNTGKLTLAAAKLIAGSQIRTERGGSVDISGMEGHVEVWTKNILTVRDVTGATGGQSIRIKNADCYVADDMTIGAENSTVSIAGNYYGYTTVGGGVTGADSSAIVINAGRSTLDLSNLSTLWLAGRGSLRVPDLYGGDTSASAYREIMEGETISYKGNQLAYLVPGECIREFGHNPLTKAEYDAIHDNLVDVSVEFGTNGKMTLANYVASVPCEVVPVRFLSETEPLYYVYLKFKTAAAAQDYFQRYSEVNKSQLDEYAKVLQLGEVRLPVSGNIKTSGTIIRVEDGHKIAEVIPGAIDSAEAFQKQTELKQNFSGLVAMLDENYNGVPGGSLVNNIIRMSELPAREEHLYFDKDMKKVSEADPDGYEVIVTNGDLSFASKEFRGIVIARGKITMQGGKFTGMMLATDDITLRNADVTGGSAFVKDLIDKNESLQRYFTNYPLPAGDGDGEKDAAARNISVSFENWRKN